MKPFLRKNPYIGINAHHNSWLQATNNWKGFHSQYLSRLYDEFKSQLLDLGYIVSMEESVQVRRSSDDFTTYFPDLAVFNTQIVNRPKSATIAPNIEVALADLIEEEVNQEAKYLALVIKKRANSELVAWVELLSPANKPPSSDFRDYEKKRHEVFEMGITFVEIDFLHQQPTTWRKLPTYGKAESAMPYRIVVVNPRPNLAQGKAQLAEFGIAEVIPAVIIPLSGDDQVKIDFNAPYQRLFVESLYGADVDYAQPPLNFESYTAVDREAILQLMHSLPTE
jgi:hypothetical protein